MESVTQSDLIGRYIVPWGIRILFAVVILVVGRWIAKRIVGFLRRLMQRAELDEMLVSFLCNIAYAMLLVVVVLAALDQLGVNTTSALAVLGAAGLAIGLALQSSLSNFASGVMLILFRPFNKGDFVEAAGVSGVVEDIRMFSTVLHTVDNREIVIPNDQINSDKIINYSARDTRRVDLVFGIGYGDDLAKAKQLLDEAVAAEKRILQDPAAVIMVSELADSSVNIAVRPWVNSADYWDVRAALLESVKSAFDLNGISIPFPQRDVHVIGAPVNTS